jgi:hypothetical protein
LIILGLGSLLALGVGLTGYCLSSEGIAQGPVEPTPEEPPTRPPAPAPRQPKVVTSNPQEKRLPAAIERGIHYLEERLEAEPFETAYGFYPDGETGAAALAALTLLECGIPDNDRAVLKAVEKARANAATMKRTYSISLAILLLDRIKDARDEPLLQRLGLRLLAGQIARQNWGYQCPMLTPAQEEVLLAQLKRGEACPPGTSPEKFATNSNTQFAILALWTARKHGVPADLALRDVAQHLRATQNADGSWGYADKDLAGVHRDSMTCVGLLGLAVGLGLDQPLEKGGGGALLHDPAIERGLQFLGQRLGQTETLSPQERNRRLREAADLVEQMPRWARASTEERKLISKKIQAQLQWRGAYVGADAMGDLYFLWSVERVAVLFDLARIGGKDWYAWGSTILLDQQKTDGSWRERFPGIPDTCFALLFLKRASLIKDLRLGVHGGNDRPAVVNQRAPE